MLTMKNSWGAAMRRMGIGLLVIGVCLGGVTACDKFKSGSDDSAEEDDDDKDRDKDKDDKPAPDTTATAESESQVVTYPETIEQSGTYRLLRSFVVYRAADATSVRITGLARGTLVNVKGTHRGFLLIDWPSGPGELSPGWVQARVNSSRFARVEKPPTSLPVASTIPVASASAAVVASAAASADAHAAGHGGAEPATSASAHAEPEPSASADVEPEATASAAPSAEPAPTATSEPATTAKPMATAKRPIFKISPSFKLKKTK
jgi:hypothetical protein